MILNRQTPFSQREHHFYVVIAKYLFLHAEHGIVPVGEPLRLKEAQRYGLRPLILYGLTVAGLPIRWMTFAPLDQPRAVRGVLPEAWRKAAGLRGRPDILRIGRHLAAACPGLAGDMSKIGVHVEVADSKEKSLPGSLRSAQDSCRWLPRQHIRSDWAPPGAMQALCRDAQKEHDFDVREDHRGLHSREVNDRIRQWLALPMHAPAPAPEGGLDWEPGPWLSSWEASLPPDGARSFSFDEFDGRIWLMIDEEAPEDFDADEEYQVYRRYDNAAEIAKNLVACWPNPPAEIAGHVGITLRALQWFTSETAPLDTDARYALEDVLGIELDDHFDVYRAAGPYVLMARKPGAVREVYESLSHGGDACPFEIVPRRGAADPSWRYVLITLYDDPPSILMAPRGEKITERLPELLLNYDGIHPVASEFYRDVVSTCAQACCDPAANGREMKEFARRYEKRWKECTWQPE